MATGLDRHQGRRHLLAPRPALSLHLAPRPVRAIPPFPSGAESDAKERSRATDRAPPKSSASPHVGRALRKQPAGGSTARAAARPGGLLTRPGEGEEERAPRPAEGPLSAAAKRALCARRRGLGRIPPPRKVLPPVLRRCRQRLLHPRRPLPAAGWMGERRAPAARLAGRAPRCASIALSVTQPRSAQSPSVTSAVTPTWEMRRGGGGREGGRPPPPRRQPPARPPQRSPPSAVQPAEDHAAAAAGSRAPAALTSVLFGSPPCKPEGVALPSMPGRRDARIQVWGGGASWDARLQRAGYSARPPASLTRQLPRRPRPSRAGRRSPQAAERGQSRTAGRAAPQSGGEAGLEVAGAGLVSFRCLVRQLRAPKKSCSGSGASRPERPERCFLPRLSFAKEAGGGGAGGEEGPDAIHGSPPGLQRQQSQRNHRHPRFAARQKSRSCVQADIQEKPDAKSSAPQPNACAPGERLSALPAKREARSTATSLSLPRLILHVSSPNCSCLRPNSTSSPRAAACWVL
ncbi:serine/arginine repetitive matrix protein 1-like [Hemicordylus capensis]|uniref:serine/arginine repetitive matrix protein 1-like n=1 Tax=Hemicordylus capensis TaxID=884348 RepID=UPI00230386DF|nr:serine/arginine repetitive matrix protein 1-like [Hemicordylus capensis]